MNLVVTRRSRTGYHFVAVPRTGRTFAKRRHRLYTLWRIEASLAPPPSHDIRRKGLIFGDGKAVVMGVGLKLRDCREIIRNQGNRR